MRPVPPLGEINLAKVEFARTGGFGIARRKLSGGADIALMTQVRHLLAQIDARWLWICGALLGIDAFFVAVFAVHRSYVSLFNDHVPLLGLGWDIGSDWTYSERFGYLKSMLIVSLLISIKDVWRRPVYLVFIAIFTFVFVDDAFQVHERLGLRIAEGLALQAFGGLRPVDPGELLVWTIFGVPLVAAAVAAIVRSSREDAGNGLLLIGALALLALFAVVADMMHVVVGRSFWGADSLFTMIEDGGEQITLSLICCLVILIRREVRAREHQLSTPPDAKPLSRGVTERVS